MRLTAQRLNDGQCVVGFDWLLDKEYKQEIGNWFGVKLFFWGIFLEWGEGA